jgi:flagellar hook-associated protein 1 FlgK
MGNSPFFGLDIGLKSLIAQQTAMDIAAHNTANANTEGYSRQRARLVASDPFAYPALNRKGTAGQMGTGVTVAVIERVRDAFIDLQIRSEVPLQGQWETRRDELAKVESIFPEPSSAGLGDVLSRFWGAWQDVAADPSSTATRSAAIEQAGTLVARFNRDAAQLDRLSSNLDAYVGSSVAEVNDLARRLATLNDQIQGVTVAGDHANDLADQRDVLLDQLNAILPVQAQPEADGTYTVLVGGVDLVNHGRARDIVAAQDPANNGRLAPTWSSGGAVQLGNGKLSALVDLRDTQLTAYREQLDTLARGIADAVNRLHRSGVDLTGAAGLDFFTYDPAKGAAASLAVNPAVAADSRRVAVSSATAGSPPAPPAPGNNVVAGLIADLRTSHFSVAGGTSADDLVVGDTLATGGAARVSSLFAAGAKVQGYTFSGASPSLTLTGADGSTQTITVADMAAGSTQVLNFSQLGISITLQATGAKSAADIVTDLTAAANDTISVVEGAQTSADFYAEIVGLIGSDSRQASEMATNEALVVDHLKNRRESVSGVSLDEEATDMIRFQRAYQAATRVITAMDEMLDVLINRTGAVGR